MTTPDTQWHLDRKVPITIIVALLLQTAGVVWWAASEEARLTAVMQRDAAQDDRINDLSIDVQAQKVNSATMQAQLSAIKDTLDQLRQDQRETADLIRQSLQKGN